MRMRTEPQRNKGTVMFLLEWERWPPDGGFGARHVAAVMNVYLINCTSIFGQCCSSLRAETARCCTSFVDVYVYSISTSLTNAANV